MTTSQAAASPPSPQPHDDTDRRLNIVRAATPLFRSKGFNGTTVRDIADAVGILSGSLFYHFSSKEDILFAVMEEGLKQGIARVEAEIAKATTAEERFRALIRTQLRTIHIDDADVVPVIHLEWRHLSRSHQQKLLPLKERFDAIMQTRLDELQREGQIAVDGSLVRLMIYGAITFSSAWYRPDGPLSLEEIADQMVSFFTGGRIGAGVKPR